MKSVTQIKDNHQDFIKNFVKFKGNKLLSNKTFKTMSNGPFFT